MTRSRIVSIALLVGVVVLAGCAAGPNDAVATGTQPAGFWLGLWQGLIVPITFVISLFTDHVNIYEVNNNGNWYDFGYVLGLSCAFGSGAGSRSVARRRSRSGIRG